MASSFGKTVESSVEAVQRLERKKSNTIQKQNGTTISVQDDTGSVVPEEPSPSDLSAKNNALVSDVLRRLERLIVSDDWVTNPKLLENGTGEADAQMKKSYNKHLPHLDELGRTVITSYSLKAYIKLLPRNHSFTIASHLHKTTSDALSKFMRFTNGVSRFHDDFYACFGLAVKLAKKQVFHANSLASENAGVVYLSPGLPYTDIPQYLETELGVRFVTSLPAMTTPFMAVDSRLDVSAFEKVLEEDALHKKVPLLVVAVVGSSVFGHNDLVSKLLELRERYRFWLHLIGLNVAALAISEPQEHLLRVIQSTDSFTAPLGQWLGVQGLPHLTMHKRVEALPLHYLECLESLPWWIVVNDLGSDVLKKRLDEAYLASKNMLKCLAKFEQLEIIGIGSVNDVLTRIEKKSLTPPAVLTFKYYPGVYRVSEDAKNILDDDYIDCLNLWLGQGVIHDCPNLALQLVDLTASKLGTALRYCPLESSASHGTTIEHVNFFGKRLEATLRILDVTVKAKLKLPEILKEHSELKSARLPKWAGVSGLTYIPAMLREAASNLNEKQKQQVSHLNIELVHALRNTDSAFTLGDSDEGVTCVKLGMLADEKDLAELINLVLTKGKEIEESSQYIESLAEMVKQGIEAANEDLKKENENRLMHEGVLRQVPVVSYMLNWWSPLPKESTKGRAFDLKTGRILSTDTVYKHKLMVAMDDESSSELTSTHRTTDYSEEAEEESVSESGKDDTGSTTGESDHHRPSSTSAVSPSKGDGR